MKLHHLFSILAVGFCSTSIIAQDIDATKSKRFSLGLNFGTGYGQANMFNDLDISDFGHSSLSASGVGHFELDYALTEYYSVTGGIAVQSLSLRYVFEDSEYRYNDSRTLVPLGMRLHLGSKDSPAKIILGIGGYYVFDSGASLESNDGFTEENVFNGFGLWTSLGFSYAINDFIGFNASISILNDMSTNYLRTKSSFVSFGTHVKL
ncbi:MAG: hypothetical protein LAT54_04025 [Cryomorphaceae bacterium]|nr:hypothetical protein [Cryomorphaceae bacterium]